MSPIDETDEEYRERRIREATDRFLEGKMIAWDPLRHTYYETDHNEPTCTDPYCPCNPQEVGP